MTNKMSSRDKIMMGVLGLVVVAALWYMLFFTPNKARIEELRGSESQKGLIQTTNEENTEVLNDINVLKGWMEDLGLTLEDDDKTVTDFTKIADYNNLVELTDEVNQILGVTETFSLSFSPPSREENCWRRDISVTFKANSREDAYNVLRSFNEMEHGCLLNNITFTVSQGENGAESANVSCNITIFEYEETPQVEEDVAY